MDGRCELLCFGEHILVKSVQLEPAKYSSVKIVLSISAEDATNVFTANVMTSLLMCCGVAGASRSKGKRNSGPDDGPGAECYTKHFISTCVARLCLAVGVGTYSAFPPLHLQPLLFPTFTTLFQYLCVFP
jgi:hypothetical protein